MARPVIAIDARYGLRKVRRGVGEYVYQLLKHLADYDRPYELQVFGDGSADAEVVRSLSQIYPVTVLPVPNFFWWEQVAFARAARHAALWHGTANIGPPKPMRKSLDQSNALKSTRWAVPPAENRFWPKALHCPRH